MAAKWRLLIYMSAEGNGLQSEAIGDLLELFRARASLLARFDDVFVQCGLGPDADGWVPDGRGAAYRVPSWKGVRRFRLGETITYFPDIGELASTRGLGVIDAEVLAQFLLWESENREKGVEYSTILILWGHGGGFTTVLMSAEAKLPLTALDGDSAQAAASVVPTPLPLSVTFSKPADAPRMRAHELGAGLTEGLRGAKLDVIGFDSCYMAAAEVMYELRKHARLIVASQELTPDAGWNYATWPTRPWNDAEQLGKALIADYDPPASLARTLSAVRLDQIDPVVAALDRFYDVSSTLSGTDWQIVKSARMACKEYGDHPDSPATSLCTIDLIAFFQAVSAASPAGDLRLAAQAVVDAALASTVAAAHGSERGSPFGSNGISIFFPSTLSRFSTLKSRNLYSPGNDAERAVAPEFVLHSKWPRFLQAYWSH